MVTWVKTGTVDVTNGSTTVIGHGTMFVDEFREGDGFVGPDDRLYEVLNLVSNTQMTLGKGYNGITENGRPYAVIPIQGYLQRTADMLRELTLEAGETISSPNVSALAQAIAAANGVLYFTTSTTMATAPSQSYGRGLLNLADAVALRAIAGLNNVDNTSDLNKPVSSATQALLNGKQPLHTSLTGLSSVAAGVDRLPIFTNNAGAMTFLQVNAAGKQLVGASTWDNVRTLIEVTRPLCSAVSESRDFNTILTQGWWPELVANSAANSPNAAFGLSSTNPAAPYWYVHNNIYQNSDTHILQTAYPYATDDTNRAAPVWRVRYGGVWGNWRRALTMGDVISGTYDGTPGKVVTTGSVSGDGWMGLGATSTPAVANLNTIANTSFYTFNDTAVGRPPQFGYGNVLTMIRAGNEGTQIAYSVVSHSSVIRYKLNGTWSAWATEYNSLNVAGAVSASGSTNTGAVIERGTGPNGNWTRYADGTLDMWGVSTISVPQSSAPVPVNAPVSLPFNFIDTGFITVAQCQPHTTWTGVSGVAFCSAGSTSYFNVQVHNTTGTQLMNIYWRSIGRWRNA